MLVVIIMECPDFVVTRMMSWGRNLAVEFPSQECSRILIKRRLHTPTHVRKGVCKKKNSTLDRKMAQNDFFCLQLSDLSEGQIAPLRVLPNPVFSAPCACLADEGYVPVNYIPDEVLAMIKAWEMAEQQIREAKEVSGAFNMPLDSVASSAKREEVFERIVHIPIAVPPKRFYRTVFQFQGLVTQRVLERRRESVYAQIKAQTV